MNEEAFLECLAQKRIAWKFIVEGAPWWGGRWEWLARSLKTALRKVLGRSSLTFRELETLLTEVEAAIHSIPLAYIYKSADEPSQITPAHFLVGYLLTIVPERTSRTTAVTSTTRTETLRRLKYRHRLVEVCWNRQ